jgi:hypothetical protein
LAPQTGTGSSIARIAVVHNKVLNIVYNPPFG